MESYIMESYAVIWTSSFCPCRAEQQGDDIQHAEEDEVRILPCDEEHSPWSECIGRKELERLVERERNNRKERVRNIEKAMCRGVPASFFHIIERYLNAASDFHREPEVKYNENAPSADLGLYLHESLGVRLSECSNPKCYADLLAGKAVLGLSEKMWLEDYFGAEREKLGVPFFPEELVVGGSIDLKAAEKMFHREMQPELLWVCGWEE